MKNLLLVIFFISAFPIFASDLPEGVYAGTGPEAITAPEVEHKRPWGIGFSIGDNNSRYTSKGKTGLIASFNFLYTFSWEKFFTTTRGTTLWGMYSAPNKKDYDLTTTDNRNVRVVEDEATYGMSEISIEQLFGTKFNAGKKLVLEPYVGIGYGRGQYEVEHELKTNRNTPIPFSDHNRYKLTSTHNYDVTKFIGGVNIPIKRFWFSFEGQFRKVNERKSAQDQKDIGLSAETNYFPQSTFGDIPVANSEILILLGGGIRF